MRSWFAPMLLALALGAGATQAFADARALSGFSVVAASGKYRVEVEQGEGFAVRVDGADAARVQTVVSRGTLRITQRGSWFGAGRHLDAVVHVRMPAVSGLSASQGVSLRAAGVNAQALDLNAAQGGQLNVSGVRAGAVTLSAAQGGAIEVSGACERLEANASMGGAIEADDLACASAEANASMGGVVEVHASASVDASASMGGVIDVSGAPGVRSSSSTMGGEIDIQ